MEQRVEEDEHTQGNRDRGRGWPSPYSTSLLLYPALFSYPHARTTARTADQRYSRCVLVGRTPHLVCSSFSHWHSSRPSRPVFPCEHKKGSNGRRNAIVHARRADCQGRYVRSVLAGAASPLGRLTNCICRCTTLRLVTSALPLPPADADSLADVHHLCAPRRPRVIATTFVCALARLIGEHKSMTASSRHSFCLYDHPMDCFASSRVSESVHRSGWPVEFTAAGLAGMSGHSRIIEALVDLRPCHLAAKPYTTTIQDRFARRPPALFRLLVRPRPFGNAFGWNSGVVLVTTAHREPVSAFALRMLLTRPPLT